MFNPFYSNIYSDDYGNYVIEVEQNFDGRTIEWRKYNNSPRIKRLGGMYASYCQETDQIKFYRNDYMRAHGFNKFIDDAQKAKCIWEREDETN